MKYINLFKTHASYEEKLNGGVVDISLPNISYCEDVKDIHYTPYNLVRFYVGEITGTTPQTVYIDIVPLGSVNNSTEEVQVSEENKWYTYVLPKDKGLYRISGNTVNKVVVKADISFKGPGIPDYIIIPSSTVEASFKGSNTSKVTNMRNMFYNCCNLKSLDVSNFDTSKVNDMRYMFNGCSGLTSLDLRNFDTSNVTLMGGMFYGCSGLKSLDLSNFDTSNVTDMDSVFIGCRGLTSLDLSNFDTSNVTDMSFMFKNCNSLAELDLSRWNTSKVNNNTTNMFKGCTSLKIITMKGCNQTTIDKIKAQLTKDGISLNNVNFVTK